ncbi:unnamed protein product, partial [Didymodactylos carnosus]
LIRKNPYWYIERLQTNSQLEWIKLNEQYFQQINDQHLFDIFIYVFGYYNLEQHHEEMNAYERFHFYILCSSIVQIIMQHYYRMSATTWQQLFDAQPFQQEKCLTGLIKQWHDHEEYGKEFYMTQSERRVEKYLRKIISFIMIEWLCQSSTFAYQFLAPDVIRTKYTQLFSFIPSEYSI